MSWCWRNIRISPLGINKGLTLPSTTIPWISAVAVNSCNASFLILLLVLGVEWIILSPTLFTAIVSLGVYTGTSRASAATHLAHWRRRPARSPRAGSWESGWWRCEPCAAGCSTPHCETRSQCWCWAGHLGTLGSYSWQGGKQRRLCSISELQTWSITSMSWILCPLY